jgi:hypothetical protein
MVTGRGLVASLDRAEIDQRVLAFGLVMEAGWASQFSAQSHFGVMVGALGDLGFPHVAAEDGVQ